MVEDAGIIDIQSCACKALMDISLNFGVKQDRIASLGGLQCTIAAMNNHTEDGNVQKYACRILSWMCYDDKSTYRVASLGGMKYVISAMRKHAKHVAVQDNACKALKYLCKSVYVLFR